MVSVDVKHCERRINRCRGQVLFVKIEVAVLGSLPLVIHSATVDVTQH